MAMRIPPITDFAAMCVRLTPLPEPKDIVLEGDKKSPRQRSNLVLGKRAAARREQARLAAQKKWQLKKSNQGKY